MKKTKLFMFLIFIVAMLLIPNIVNAAVDYTRTIPSNDGTIKINFTGLNINPNEVYEFALTRQGRQPENWLSIDDGYTTSEATVTLNAATPEIRDVLKVTDTGYIYIRKDGDTSGEYVLQAHQVNLKLPYLQSLAYTKTNEEYQLANLLYESIGNHYNHNNVNGDGMTYSKWVKVTDTDLIESFLNIKNNDYDISELENALPQNPAEGYSEDRTPDHTKKNDGLYLLWVKRTGQNCKDVFSCIVHDGLLEATTVAEYIEVPGPTVKSIAVTSPNSGTYNTSQTVKIRVNFSEKITGSSVPTLKIKFGTSQERNVTNGVIKDSYIEYSYNIQNGDNGQLATVSLTGGTIKNAAGADAVLSCPIISGNTIKANTEGTITNNTDNQDKINNNQGNNNNNQNVSSKPSNTNNTSNTTNTTNTNNNVNNNTNKTNNDNSKNKTNNNNETKKDNTTAKGIIPQTGTTATIITIITVLTVPSVIGLKKYIKYIDAK